MRYVKVVNGVASDYSLGQLYRDNPEVSFPAAMSQGILNAFDVYEAVETEPPAFDDRLEKVTEDGFEFVGGAWVLQWLVTALTVPEIEEVTATKKAEAKEAALASRTAPEALTKALEVVTRVSVTPLLETLSAADLEAVVALYPTWEEDLPMVLDAIYAYEGVLYRVVQSHNSQANWTPDAVPALFTAYTPPGVVAAWVQPLGAQDAYQIGDRVTHNGSTWESTSADNVWEPGVFGWVLA